jgi:prolipoprotein diacylglyceryl transferase
MIINLLNYITWNVNPVVIELLGREIRWYGILFALGFVVGHFIMTKIFEIEKIDIKNLDALTYYMIFSTVIGARLGHCFFYEPDYYLANPSEIIAIWKGGLASHGAAIGILFALWLYSRSRPEQPFLWIVDRIVITVAFAGVCIRLGNLMNHEIIGKPTDLPWAFVFTLVDQQPRHPSQLYEAICYAFIFIFLYRLYFHKYTTQTPQGLLLGWFLVLIFGVRILVEFLKEDQVANEQDLVLIPGLNMGQNLSIPFVLFGIYLIYNAIKNYQPKSSMD